MRLLGLDEAGRGCVLGPLVVGAFFCESAPDLDLRLRAAGATDSKRLTAKRRETVRSELLCLGTPACIEVSPAEIDAGNLNELEERAFCALILRFQPDHVWIDAPCHPAGIPGFIRRVSAVLQAENAVVPMFTVEPKADFTYPIVGAASIFAKVQRDAHITAMGPVGSGYPSDPITRAWLKGFIDRDEAFPSTVRTRWGTIDKLRGEGQAE